MTFNDFLKKIFNYDPSSNYLYDLSEMQIQNNIKEPPTSKKVSSSLSENLNFLTVKYNALINSDINIRKFTLNAKGKQYNAALIYIDGMINSDLINHYVLEPLMLKNKTNSETSSETLIVNKNQDLNYHTTQIPNLKDLVFNSLLPQNTVKTENEC